MAELDDIFRVPDTDSPGSDDPPRKPKLRSKLPGRTGRGSNPLVTVGYEDSEEAVDDLRDRFEDKYEKSQQALEDLKREHSDKLAMLKYKNAAQEQARANSYDTEDQNLVWSVTLKHVGCGMFTEDLGNALQHHLNEEQFKFEKEILELQQQLDEELAQARQEKPSDVGGYRRRRRRLVRTIDPQQMAEIICQRIADAEDTLTRDVIDGLIKILRMESRHLVSYHPVSAPGRRHSPKTRAPRRPPPTPEDAGGPANLQKHIKARAKLRRAVAHADRFVYDLHGQKWFQDLFPHIE
jgi:hypothetical protein